MSKKREIKLHFHKIKVKDIISHSINPFKQQILEKEIQVKLDIAHEDLEVYADATKVVWVLMNLLSNALRYSSRWGKIDISASDEGNSVRVCVKDRGKGMSQRYIKSIFKPLIASPEDIQAKGIGLALFISKEIIEAHGGQITVESELGEGSCFCCLLPKD